MKFTTPATTNPIDTLRHVGKPYDRVDGPLNCIIGGYYFNEKLHTQDQIVYGPDFRNYANILIGGPITSPPNDGAVDALEAQFSALTGQNPINKYEASPTPSQPKNRPKKLADITNSSIAAMKRLR